MFGDQIFKENIIAFRKKSQKSDVWLWIVWYGPPKTLIMRILTSIPRDMKMERMGYKVLKSVDSSSITKCDRIFGYINP